MTNAVNLASAAGTGFAFRNRIINGAMEINQRSSASYTINAAGDTYTLDRFAAGGQSADGVYTVQPSSDAPAGFIKSALITVTTADASIGSTQYYDFQQNIEGTNIADFAFGTASAKTITLSFWVKSSLTGSFGGAFRNGSFNRSYPFLYTITNANTWEYKTVTIPGDTTGTWLTDNQNGLNITWSLSDGSSRLSTAGSWQAGNFAGATGQTQIMATNGATWRITGVQLEVGSVATPFERRPYGQELALCQRYYAVVNGGADWYASVGLQVFRTIHTTPEMRTTATAAVLSNINNLNRNSYILTAQNTNAVQVDMQAVSGAPLNVGGTSRISLSAEL